MIGPTLSEMPHRVATREQMKAVVTVFVARLIIVGVVSIPIIRGRSCYPYV